MLGTSGKGLTFDSFWPSSSCPFWVLRILLRFENFPLNKVVSQNLLLCPYNSKGALLRPYFMCDNTLAFKRDQYWPLTRNSSIIIIETMNTFKKISCTVYRYTCAQKWNNILLFESHLWWVQFSLSITLCKSNAQEKMQEHVFVLYAWTVSS